MENCNNKPSHCFTQGNYSNIVQQIVAFEMPYTPNGIQLIMPNPTNGLILQYGDPSYYSFDGIKFVPFPRFYFALPSISRKSMLFKCDGHYRALLVIFRPGVVSTAFKFPLSECSKSIIIDASYVIQKKIYDTIVALMEYRESSESMINQLQGLFLHIQNSEICSSITVQAIDQIIANRGIISPSDLSQQLGLSLRTLERKFKYEQGISPYTYSRLVKHHSILREIHTNSNIDWFDIVVRYKFHDRAHYINDFKKMTGLNSLLNNGYRLNLDKKTRIEFQ